MHEAERAELKSPVQVPIFRNQPSAMQMPVADRPMMQSTHVQCSTRRGQSQTWK